MTGARAGRPVEDVSLQNAVIGELEHVKGLGVSISPGICSAGMLYQALGVKARTPNYTLDEFEAYLEFMVKRGLIQAETFYRSTKPLMV